MKFILMVIYVSVCFTPSLLAKSIVEEIRKGNGNEYKIQGFTKEAKRNSNSTNASDKDLSRHFETNKTVRGDLNITSVMKSFIENPDKDQNVDRINHAEGNPGKNYEENSLEDRNQPSSQTIVNDTDILHEPNNATTKFTQTASLTSVLTDKVKEMSDMNVKSHHLSERSPHIHGSGFLSQNHRNALSHKTKHPLKKEKCCTDHQPVYVSEGKNQIVCKTCEVSQQIIPKCDSSSESSSSSEQDGSSQENCGRVKISSAHSVSKELEKLQLLNQLKAKLQEPPPCASDKEASDSDEMGADDFHDDYSSSYSSSSISSSVDENEDQICQEELQTDNSLSHSDFEDSSSSHLPSNFQTNIHIQSTEKDGFYENYKGQPFNADDFTSESLTFDEAQDPSFEDETYIQVEASFSDTSNDETDSMDDFSESSLEESKPYGETLAEAFVTINEYNSLDNGQYISNPEYEKAPDNKLLEQFASSDLPLNDNVELGLSKTKPTNIGLYPQLSTPASLNKYDIRNDPIYQTVGQQNNFKKNSQKINENSNYIISHDSDLQTQNGCSSYLTDSTTRPNIQYVSQIPEAIVPIKHSQNQQISTQTTKTQNIPASPSKYNAQSLLSKQKSKSTGNVGILGSKNISVTSGKKLNNTSKSHELRSSKGAFSNINQSENLPNNTVLKTRSNTEILIQHSGTNISIANGFTQAEGRKQTGDESYSKQRPQQELNVFVVVPQQNEPATLQQGVSPRNIWSRTWQAELLPPSDLTVLYSPTYNQPHTSCGGTGPTQMFEELTTQPQKQFWVNRPSQSILVEGLNNYVPSSCLPTMNENCNLGQVLSSYALSRP